MTTELPFPSNERTLRALAATIVPEAASLSQEGWRELYRVIGEALAPRPSAVKRQLSLFVRVLDSYSLMRYRRRIPALTESQRQTLLQSIERSPVLLLRKGLWGLRTLVFMGFYARPAAVAELQYGADPRGWQRPSFSSAES